MKRNLRRVGFGFVCSTGGGSAHVRIRVVDSQCTGGPLYAGEQDDDPRAATDCATASPLAAHVRIAELQVFER